jgi:hypothetical protein
MVPRVVVTDAGSNSTLLSWADGTLPRNLGAADIDQAVTFLNALADLPGAAEFPPTFLASEACLSGVEIARQLRARVGALSEIAGEVELSRFLNEELAPELEDRVATARQAFASSALSFEHDLSLPQRRLVPADFGFHNALRDSTGELTFIDFEYFGWDDPVKLTADVLLHPGMPVAPGLRTRFRVAAERLYGRDPRFTLRLVALYPLFGLRWALILLNEFHPERWRRRVQAGAAEAWGDAKARQLIAAKDMLATSRTWGNSE